MQSPQRNNKYNRDGASGVLLLSSGENISVTAEASLFTAYTNGTVTEFS